jgi:hypothetical protein
MKLNSIEFEAGGFQPEEYRELCRKFESHRLDSVDLSGGLYEHLAFHHKTEDTRDKEGIFLEFADMVKPALTKTRVYVTGGLRTRAGTVRAVITGSCDGVGLARFACAKPDLPAELMNGIVRGAIINKSAFDESNFCQYNFVVVERVTANSPFALVLTDNARGLKSSKSAQDENLAKKYKKTIHQFLAKLNENIAKGVVTTWYPEFKAGNEGQNRAI